MSEALVQLQEIELLGQNPDAYCAPLKWRVRVEALENFSEPISISFVWVGSASSSEYDQHLDSFDIGPLTVGVTEFQLECDAPQVELVPPGDVLGVTILIISFQFRSQEFLRVGYYVQVAYFEDEKNQHPPQVPDKNALGRFLAMPQPVVTFNPLVWQGQTPTQ
ncbi:histone chaperone ASF1 [Angomonas deanei]|uniref:ASF1 like histone chaperone, putative n=1 Tax=Angomonas deanei TaxID=59799 RepID=S9VZG2_9TRYP|nr:histone chaperone ASF1 [Angomonas deanei]EPY32541.1 histone chaperone ASF1 [Angomonas deanei]EPY42346.1 histone chaperone ASF1 [Angomonas deanei]CAD2215318.1 ASF1 like histone chaperone, putative [Angomonas deanei]|eukprot:EPY24699.1 histone chaperone ASF1 [Angomonas deanei]